jgi:hypothetical protein
VIKTSKSTRLVRISATSDGGVAEIKLVQSSLGNRGDVFLTLPASIEQVVTAVHQELTQLLSK